MRIFNILLLLGGIIVASPSVAHSAPWQEVVQRPLTDTTRRQSADTTARPRARTGQDSSSRSAAQSLDTVTVITRATRATGYATPRSSSATKINTPLRDVPQSVTVVTRTLIRDQAMQSMGDVVRYVPGITMGQGEGHRDAPTIRGNSSTADFYVDGVRDDAQYYRDLYNVERVEALKGSNAMIFGRGGGGGVLNRVTKAAQWTPVRELTLEGGSYDHKRMAVDVGQGLTSTVAARLNGMYENSGAFRDRVNLERYGITPTLTITPGAHSTISVGYEYFNDHRTVDRGIPSFQGRPSDADVTTFFGNPDASYADARVHAATALIEHATTSGLMIRNRTRFVHYDKFYRNVYPGAVNAARTQVSLSAYDHATTRGNLFNQTDLTYALNTGAIQHTLLVGAELGRQTTDDFRNTGFFDDTAKTVAVPFDSPTVFLPVTFRQSATDADNHVTNTVAALYAQNQVALSSHWQAIAGVRYERFDIRFRSNRNGQLLRREDNMISPRVGLVFKPTEPLSFYSGYSVSYLPSAGDQFSSLTATTQTLAPERFANYEVGAKWDIRPDFALTTAVYQLDRTNTKATDPTDPTRLVQTGSQRTKGVELGATGRVTSAWQVVAGFASQRATITSATTAAPAGAKVQLVPNTTASLWNRYQLTPIWGVGLGIVHQSSMYAAIDNAVTLPDFTRLDGALYVALTRDVRAQVNVENLLNERYYPTSHGNNNIMPGAPRTLRITLTTGH